ncbi:MAG TPA: hypothetical protein VJU60_06675 [Thermoleophilaceae bacterium]|nr:hypothetical protein [Thermoleophilaceae bacterium]
MDERQGSPPSAREAALARAARAKRWVAGGAVALTGVFSAVAAHALPAGHSTKPKPTSSAPPAPAIDQGDDQQAVPLAPPDQAPAPSAADGGAVSGGS